MNGDYPEMNPPILEPISVEILMNEVIDPRAKGQIGEIAGRMDFSFFTDIKGWITQSLITIQPIYNDTSEETKKLLEIQVKKTIWRKFHEIMETGQIEIMEEQEKGTEKPVVHRILAVARVPIITEVVKP